MELSAEKLLCTTDKLTKVSEVICNYINEKYAHKLPDVIDLYMPQEVLGTFTFQYIMEAKLVKVTEQGLVLEMRGASNQGIIDISTAFDDRLVVVPYPKGSIATSKAEVKAFLEEMVYAAENRYEHMRYMVSQKKDSR